ncbi:MAG: FGGY family carbohydrate kinase, partial [Chloroflexota bacterium]|nr:FGGY family carbohydrate kinase [Chloroflexota bacterium]
MIIGVDAGTSVVKAVAFGDDGDVLRVAARPTRTLTPAPGHAEQDLEEVIAAVGEVVREVSAGEAPLLVGITAQGDGLWLLDAEGWAVRPPILWSDARAAGVLAAWLRSGVADQGFRYCGSVLFPG